MAMVSDVVNWRRKSCCINEECSRVDNIHYCCINSRSCFSGRVVYFRPVGESAIYVLKAFGCGFSIGLICILNCYSVYVYIAPGNIVQYESEYEVTFPGPAVGKYSHCEAGLWIKDAHTKRWLQLCTNRTNLYNDRKQGMTKVWVTAHTNKIGSYIINYKFTYD